MKVRMDLKPCVDSLFRAVTRGDKDTLERLLRNRDIDVFEANKSGRTALMMAAGEGHVDCIKCLVDANKTANHINKRDATGNTALILASKGGHYECVKYLVETGSTNVNLCDLEGSTALMLTAENGHIGCVNYLIDTRLAGVNMRDGRGKSVLMLAAEKGHFEIVKILCRVKGIDVNIRDNLLGKTALMFAIVIGCTQSVKCLIETRLTDFSICDRKGNSALMYASDRGCTESVRCLIETGLTDVNLRDLKGKTAVMLAVEKGHYEIVKILSGIEEIAFDIRDNSFGMTALMLALEMGHTESAKCLIDTGLADVNLCDRDGYTALMLAAKRGYYEIVNTLTRIDGIDVNISDYHSGRTALMFASDRGCSECVQCLIETGRTDVNLCDSRNRTALMIAAERGHCEIVKTLTGIEETVVNISDDSFKRTALMLAVYAGYSKCVEFLLMRKDICINFQDKNKATALMLASEYGHSECVGILLSCDKTEVNACDDKGHTALMLASFNGHTQCVKALINSGRTEVNVHDHKGRTALMIAISRRKLECVDCIIGHKNVNIWERDKEGKTAFMLAAAIPDVRYLRCFLDITISESSDGGKEQNQGDEVFATAFSPQNPEVCVRDLPGITMTRRRPDINGHEQNKESVANLVIRNSRGRCLKCFLLAYRYSPICEDHLWPQCLPNKTETTDYDKDGQTALMIAVKYGNNDDCLEYLLHFERIRLHLLVVMMQKELCETGTIFLDIYERLYSLVRNDNSIDRFLCMICDGGKIGKCVDLLLSAFICGTNSSGNSALLNALHKHGEKTQLKLLIQHVQDKSVLFDSLETLHQEGRLIYNFKSALALAQGDFFFWKWYPESCTYYDYAKILTRELVTRDISPESFEWQGKQVSPLYHAFTSQHDHGLVRYLMANLYMTPSDLEYLQSDKEKRDQCLRQIQSHDIQRIYREHFESKPWRLESLSLLSLSVWMRENKEREDVYKVLDAVPGIIRSRLPFRNPMRIICRRQWKRINLDFLNHRLSSSQTDDDLFRGKCCGDCCLQFEKLDDDSFFQDLEEAGFRIHPDF